MVAGLYLFFAIVVGLCAIGRRSGFLLYFLLSILFTPVAALIVLIVATPIVVDTNGDVLKPRRR